MQRLKCWKKSLSNCSNCRVSWMQSWLLFRRVPVLHQHLGLQTAALPRPAGLLLRRHTPHCRHSCQERPVRAACSPAPFPVMLQSPHISIIQCMKRMSTWYALPHLCQFYLSPGQHVQHASRQHVLHNTQLSDGQQGAWPADLLVSDHRPKK